MCDVKLMEQQREIDESVHIAGDFKTPFSKDGITRQESARMWLN